MKFSDFYYEYHVSKLKAQMKHPEVRYDLFDHYILLYFSGYQIEEILPEQINAFFLKLQSEGASYVLCMKIETALRSYFYHASACGYIATKDIPVYICKSKGEYGKKHFPYIKKRPASYTFEQTRLVLEQIMESRYKNILLFQFFTGLRLCELLALRVDDYNYEKKTITIQNIILRNSIESGENRKIVPIDAPQKRTILLCEYAAQAADAALTLHKQLEEQGIQKSIALFIHPNGDYILQSQVHRACVVIQKNTGVQNFSIKTNRSNFMTMCFYLGWDAPSVRTYGGFSCSHTIVKYKELADSILYNNRGELQ